MDCWGLEREKLCLEIAVASILVDSEGVSLNWITKVKLWTFSQRFITLLFNLR